MPVTDTTDLTDEAQDALHELQIATEYLHRAYGDLLKCHHQTGHAMDRLQNAQEKLEEAGFETAAEELAGEHLPAGAVEEKWTYEIVEEYRDGFLDDLLAFEAEVREEIADGERHITEQKQRERLRERADDGSGDPPFSSDG